MEGGKEALEEFAREAVAIYGRDAPKMLLHRAEIAHLYGDPLATTWRQVAAIASRITRRTDDRAEPRPSDLSQRRAGSRAEQGTAEETGPAIVQYDLSHVTDSIPI